MHPGAGHGGTITASGRYQITKPTWKLQCIEAMGLSDFTPHTQDLTAVEILRIVHAIDPLVEGDFETATRKAAGRREALPLGPGQANRPLNGHPSGQLYMPYDEVVTTYKKFGGTTNETTSFYLHLPVLRKLLCKRNGCTHHKGNAFFKCTKSVDKTRLETLYNKRDRTDWH
jgi:hypothetical protein